MGNNASAGWYPQPDGSQRYWDGNEWTDHIAQAAGVQPTTTTPEASGSTVPVAAGAADVSNAGVSELPLNTAPSQPLWKKKGVIIGGVVAAVVLFVAVILGVSNGNTDSDSDLAATPSIAPSTSVEPTETEGPATFTVPDLVGKDLQDAYDTLEAAGAQEIDPEDASDLRRIPVLYSNWHVCGQEPEAGADVPESEAVVLSVVKEDETCAGDEPQSEPEPTDDEPALEAEAPEPQNEGPTETRSQENARKSAESYLAFTAFSREGLISQLEFEGYSNADATYGADATNADWNVQAKKSAETYLDFSAFSKSGLIEQLEFEGFTTAQAEHGVDAVNADWNAQAAEKAEMYLSMMAFSRSGLIDQLMFEGFTKAQATHGVDAAGL